MYHMDCCKANIIFPMNAMQHIYKSSILFLIVSTDEAVMGQIVNLTLEKVLELIESAYPNPVTIIDIAK